MILFAAICPPQKMLSVKALVGNTESTFVITITKPAIGFRETSGGISRAQKNERINIKYF